MSQPRPLSLFDLGCLGVNAIVGSGIYAFPGILAALLGPASVLAFVACGLISLLVALCFAEAAGLYRESGGPAVYAEAAFGRPAAFLVGWTCWAAAVVSWAAVTQSLLSYAGHLLPVANQPVTRAVIAVGVTLGLGLVNSIGVKPGAYATNLLTIAKLVPLVTLTLLGLRRLDGSRLRPFAPNGYHALPRATYVAFFAFQGFEVVPVPAGESARPERNVPVAVVASLVAATLLYVAVQWIAVGATPDLRGAEEPIARMAEAVLGTVGGDLVALAAMVSMLGFCAGVALASPRYLESLSRTNQLPRMLGALHPRHRTPHRAIWLTALCTAGLTLLLDFARLVDISVMTVATQYLATIAAIPVLRRRHPRQAYRFRLPAGALIPVAAGAVVIGLLALQLWPQHETLELTLPDRAPDELPLKRHSIVPESVQLSSAADRLQRVQSAPQAGQFQIANNKLITAAADRGQRVTLSYRYTSFPLLVSFATVLLIGAVVGLAWRVVRQRI